MPQSTRSYVGVYLDPSSKDTIAVGVTVVGNGESVPVTPTVPKEEGVPGAISTRGVNVAVYLTSQATSIKTIASNITALMEERILRLII